MGAVPFDLPAIWQAWWRALGLRGPLSGDVNQAIDASLLHTIGGQLGFIKIKAARAGDGELEQRITEQVASYRRQLGWIVDAREVLIRTDRPAGLSSNDNAALDQLTELRADVERAKEDVARDRIDRLLADIRTLRQDPKRYHDELERLRQALKDD